MMYRSFFKFFSLIALTVTLLLASCGRVADDELSEFELLHGIGPITERVTLNEADAQLAQRGKMIYDSLCIACHQLDAVVTAPRLRNTANNRSAEFILNYILYPEEMSQRHPVGQQLSSEYPGVKSRLGIERDDAFALLDYLRLVAKGEMD